MISQTGCSANALTFDMNVEIDSPGCHSPSLQLIYEIGNVELSLNVKTVVSFQTNTNEMISQTYLPGCSANALTFDMNVEILSWLSLS